MWRISFLSFWIPQYKDILFRWKMFACKVMAFPCVGLPHRLSTYIHNINTKNVMNLKWVRKQEWGLNVSVTIYNHNGNQFLHLLWIFGLVIKNAISIDETLFLLFLLINKLEVITSNLIIYILYEFYTIDSVNIDIKN